MNTIVVIPARYASTRFPGKPLALLGGKPIVDYAYAAAVKASGVQRAVVATDDDRILNHVHDIFGREAAMMTSTEHRSGTDRCGEVVRTLAAQGHTFDIVVNLQGDEPFVDPAQIEALESAFDDPQVQIATLATPIHSTDELLSPNNVRVVCGDGGRALYFSRQPIPYRRGVDTDQWLDNGTYLKHVGIYAFRSKALAEVCHLESRPLEESEKLEQLRWLSAGYTIKVLLTDHANIGIDTPDDLAAAEQYFNSKKTTTI